MAAEKGGKVTEGKRRGDEAGTGTGGGVEDVLEDKWDEAVEGASRVFRCGGCLPRVPALVFACAYVCSLASRTAGARGSLSSISLPFLFPFPSPNSAPVQCVTEQADAACRGNRAHRTIEW